jgi:hypothetical protein
MSNVTLETLLTPTNPLGPTRHERILRKLNNSTSNVLVYKTGLFDDVTQQDRPIITGRRGSGKTAVINAILARASGRNYSYGSGEVRSSTRNIIVFINSWDHFDDLVGKVGRDILIAYGADVDWNAVLAETVSKVWAQNIWNFIFQEIYRHAIRREDQKREPAYVREAIKYVTGHDFIPVPERLSSFAVNSAVEKTRQAVLDYLAENEAHCVVVIDSLEEYPVHAPRFEKVLAGFLRCINDFEDAFPRCRVICCLPEEIEHIINESYPSVLKDGGDASISRLRWKPIDLLRVVAKRYRAFLSCHLDNKEFNRDVKALDLDQREGLEHFFSEVMPDSLRNRYGKEESALAYIIRHTQLLPREFLMIFNAAILASHKEMGGSWFIARDEIVSSIEAQEENFANQVFVPYRHLYPILVSHVKEVVATLPPIFSGRDLDSCRKLDSLTKHEVSDCWSMLFEMGVIGYIEDEKDGEGHHELYEYGRFHYNSVRSIVFAPDRRYCIHPIFSGAWQCRNHVGAANMKFIYPADVPSVI